MQHSSASVVLLGGGGGGGGGGVGGGAAQQNTSNVVQICPNSKRIEIRDNKVVGRYMYNLICTCLLFIHINVSFVMEFLSVGCKLVRYYVATISALFLH